MKGLYRSNDDWRIELLERAAKAVELFNEDQDCNLPMPTFSSDPEKARRGFVLFVLPLERDDTFYELLCEYMHEQGLWTLDNGNELYVIDPFYDEHME